MTFDEILDPMIALLQREGRVTYRALKRRFGIDDDYLNDLCGEIIKAKRLAVDEDGEVLVWTGATPVSSFEFRVLSPPQPPTPQTPNSELRTSQPPSSYTPPHLAERIRAATVTEGERKTITALFADLKGSTALIEGLDPEDARAIIDPALHLMMDAVHSYDGYVAQALGVTLGVPLQATRGFSSPEVRAAYTRHGSCANRSGRPASSSRSSLGYERFIRCGASFSRRASSGNNSWAWPRGSKTRYGSWRPIGR